jgi:protein-disulfide isomerase
VATRVEQKAKAREERLAREREAADAEARKRRLMWLGGGLLVVIVAVAVVIAVASGSSSGSSSSSSGGTSASTVNKLLAGIPQNGSTLGNPNAPVQVTVYEDLECPVCQEFTLNAENKLIANDVRAGRAKLVFKSLQTATGDPTTFQVQQQAAAAAGKQNKQWNFVENFYHQQGQEGTPYVTESYLDKLAKQVPGLNYNAWLSARKGSDVSGTVSADTSAAHSKGFSSTPTIVVQGPKASPAPVAGAIDYPTLESMVKKAGG